MELVHSAVEKIQFFPEDDSDGMWTEQSADIRTTMDITNKVSAIRQMEKEATNLELQDQDSRAFYASKKAACGERIDFLKRQILAYLQSTNRRNIQTPAGTAYQRVITSRLWPHDDVLLAWCMKNTPKAIRVKSEVDKRALSEHIKSTGEAPDGYQELHQTRLYLK